MYLVMSAAIPATFAPALIARIRRYNYVFQIKIFPLIHFQCTARWRRHSRRCVWWWVFEVWCQIYLFRMLSLCTKSKLFNRILGCMCCTLLMSDNFWFTHLLCYCCYWWWCVAWVCVCVCVCVCTTHFKCGAGKRNLMKFNYKFMCKI